MHTILWDIQHLPLLVSLTPEAWPLPLKQKIGRIFSGELKKQNKTPKATDTVQVDHPRAQLSNMVQPLITEWLGLLRLLMGLSVIKEGIFHFI